MKKINILIIATLLPLISVLAQGPILKKCYMYLQGNINKETLIDINLTKLNDSIYGDFTFKGPAFIRNNNSEGVVIPFSGTSDQKGNLTFYDPTDSAGFIFRGKFVSTQSITGTFESTRGSKKIQFSVKEVYPEGSLPFVVYFQEGKTQLTRQPGSPVAHIGMALMFPAESSNISLTDTLKKLILSRFTGRNVRNSNPEMVLNGIRQVYSENYVTTNESIYSPGMDQSFSWESLKFMHIIQNASDILTFYVEEYAFTGGAHGMQTRQYTPVNLKTGKVINLQDIFKNGYEEKLTKLLTTKAQKENKLDQDASLRDAGFFVDEISPTSNFYISSGGIGFFYNHYEIAPYSFGPDDYFIPFSEVEQMIDRNGILKDLMDNQ